LTTSKGFNKALAVAIPIAAAAISFFKLVFDLPDDMKNPKKFRARFVHFHVGSRYMESRYSNAISFESTDLGEEAFVRFSSWVKGQLSARCLTMWVADKFEKSFRTRGKNLEDNNSTVLDILSGGLVNSCERIQSDHESYFRDGPEVLFLKAKAVLLGSSISPGISSISISQVNANFRRLSLDSRWASAMSAPSLELPLSSSNELKTLHIYMETIKAFVLSSNTITPEDTDSNLIQDEFRLNPQSSCQPSQTIDSIIKINSLVDDYLIHLMNVKNKTIEKLSRFYETNFYTVLGVSSDATPTELKKAYRQRAMELHPDKGGSKELFQELNEAYEAILQQRGLNIKVCPEEEPAGTEDRASEEKEEDDEPTTADTTDRKPGDGKSGRDLLIKLIKAAEKCVIGAKQVTEIASQFVSMGGVENFELLRFSRLVGYSCLEAAAVVAALNDESEDELTNIAFTILNHVSEFADSVESGDNVLEHVTKVTKNCVQGARVVSQLASVIEERFGESEPQSAEKEDPKPTTKKTVRKEDTKIHAAEKLRIENSELLRRLNTDLISQQSELRLLVDDAELIAAKDSIVWCKEVLVDNFRDIVCAVRRDARARPGLLLSADGVADDFLIRCREVIPATPEDMLAVPVSGIARACRLVIMTDLKFVRDELGGTISTELTKIAVATGDRSAMSNAIDVLKIIRSRLQSALTVFSSTCISSSGLVSKKSSTKNSPQIMPIQLDVDAFISS